MALTAPSLGSPHGGPAGTGAATPRTDGDRVSRGSERSVVGCRCENDVSRDFSTQVRIRPGPRLWFLLAVQVSKVGFGLGRMLYNYISLWQQTTPFGLRCVAVEPIDFAARQGLGALHLHWGGRPSLSCPRWTATPNWCAGRSQLPVVPSSHVDAPTGNDILDHIRGEASVPGPSTHPLNDSCRWSVDIAEN